MTIISCMAGLLATLAVVPAGDAILAAKPSSTHGATEDTVSSSLAWLKQQRQANYAARLTPHRRRASSLQQLQDETTGEDVVRDSTSPSFSSTASQVGSKTDICTTCSFPQAYTFRLAFNNSENCSTSTLQASASSYLLSGTECVMSTSEMPPTYISSVHFLEFDNTAYLNVIHENTTYLNNVTFYSDGTFTFPSSIASNSNTDFTTTTLTEGSYDEQGTHPLPGAAGLFLFGNDEDGQPILRSQIVWTFGAPRVEHDEGCANATKELEGKSVGWVIFEEVVPMDHEFCVGLSSSTTPPSSMPPSTITFSATASPFDDLSLRPTVVPTTTEPKTGAPTVATNLVSPLPTTDTDTLPTISIHSSISPTTATDIEVDGSKSSKSAQKSKTSKLSSKEKEDSSDDDGSSSLSKTAKIGTIEGEVYNKMTSTTGYRIFHSDHRNP